MTVKADKLLGYLIAAAMVGIPAWTLTEVIAIGKRVERIDTRLTDHLELKPTIYEPNHITALASPKQ